MDKLSDLILKSETTYNENLGKKLSYNPVKDLIALKHFTVGRKFF